MPLQKLKSNQTITIGAKELAIFEVPNGCKAKSRTRITHVVPIMVAEDMLGWATSIP
jgi:hypothetical protein